MTVEIHLSVEAIKPEFFCFQVSFQVFSPLSAFLAHSAKLGPIPHRALLSGGKLAKHGMGERTLSLSVASYL